MAIEPLAAGSQPGNKIIARVKVRAEIRRRLEGATEVVIPTLTDDIKTWVKADPQLCDPFLDEMLRPIVYDVVQQEVARTRGTEDELLMQGDQATRRAEAERKGQLTSRFQHWLEHVGASHRLLSEMTRDDLLTAAQEREQRAEHETLLARLWRALAKELPVGTTVGEVFTPAAIEKQYEQVVVRYQRGAHAKGKS